MENFERKVTDFLDILNNQNADVGLDDDELLDLSHGLLQSRFDDMNDDDGEDEEKEALEMTEMTGKILFAM